MKFKVILIGFEVFPQVKVIMGHINDLKGNSDYISGLRSLSSGIGYFLAILKVMIGHLNGLLTPFKVIQGHFSGVGSDPRGM